MLETRTSHADDVRSAILNCICPDSHRYAKDQAGQRLAQPDSSQQADSNTDHRQLHTFECDAFSSQLAEQAAAQKRRCIPRVHCSDGMDAGKVVRLPSHVTLHPDGRVFEVTKAYRAIRHLCRPPIWRLDR